MQFQLEHREIISSGVQASESFGMDDEDAAHVFGVLHGSLYSQKERALLREYGANAWDEHQDAGIPDVPIRVVLPTVLAPTLVVRDFGRGLSEADIYGVYARYGKSTKRTNNKAVGFLGLGSKAAFCYTDSFVVLSHHRGTRTTYVCVLGADHVGRVDKIASESCGEETGIEIRISIAPADIPVFHREAIDLFQFFKPRPDINIDLPPIESGGREHGYIRSLGVTHRNIPDWTAVVGVVPYRLDLNQMRPALEEAGLLPLVGMATGGLYFGLGDGVGLGAHREEVAYTAATKAATIAKLKLFYAEILADLAKTIDDPITTDWQKRIATVAFREETGLKVPRAYAIYAASDVALYLSTSVPRTFRLLGHPYLRQTGRRSVQIRECPQIIVTEGACLVIRDTKLAAQRYRLSKDVTFVKPIDGLSIEDVLTELRERIVAAKIDGVPILRLSELPCYDAFSRSRIPRGERSIVAPKPEQRLVLRKNAKWRVTRDNWEWKEHVPSDEDVYVLVSPSLQPLGTEYHLYRKLQQDMEHVAFLGGTFPTVICVRMMARTDVTKIQGTPYTEWYKAEIPKLLAARPDVRARLGHHEWRQEADEILKSQNRWSSPRVLPKTIVKTLRDAGFSEKHMLVQFFSRLSEATEHCDPDEPQITSLYNRITSPISDAKERVASVWKRYPLFNPRFGGPGYEFLVGSTAAPWIAYIRFLDKENPCPLPSP